MKTVELGIPIIYKDGEIFGYGGNQEWFSEHCQRYSGCASVSGANIAAYFAAHNSDMRNLYPGNIDRFDYFEFTRFMDKMFSYMLPGHMGYPYTGRFARDFKRYARDNGVNIEVVGCGMSRSVSDNFGFVKKMIDGGNPISLLILHHHAPELCADNWHWVTITGYQQGDGVNNVIISNLAQREIRSADMLFEPHKNNVIRMIAFSPNMKNI